MVQGTNSTMADDSRATVEQRTGTVATGQGGGGTGQ
jgi:hypothetical protein